MGLGRSGTTAMMSLLGTDPNVAFDRVAAFENRQLSYLAKFSILVNRRLTLPEFEEYKLRDLNESVFGPPPWYPGGFFPEPRTIDFFPGLWETFSKAMGESEAVRFYAEKTATWMSGFVAAYVEPFSIRLFRDPRDNFISALAFMRKRGNMVGFGRAMHDSDETFVRTTCYRWINFYEAWRMTQGDPRSIMVRYEDFVAAPTRVASEINERLGLKVDAGAIHVGEHHRSAATVRDSVLRHRAEGLSPELLALFDEYLGEEMLALGYTPSARPRFQKLRLGLDSVEITGADYCVYIPGEPFDAGEVWGLWLSVCARVGDHCSAYWRREGEFFSEERVVHVSYFPGEQWRVLQFELVGHPLWTGTVVQGVGEVGWYRLIGGRVGKETLLA